MRKLSDYLFFFMIGGLMVFSLAYNVLYATITPISIPLIVIADVCFLVLFAIVFNNHTTFLVTLGLIVAAGLILFARWDDSWLNVNNTTGIFAYIRGLILFIRGYPPYVDSYGPVITFGACGFLVLYMTLSLYVSFQFYFATLLGIGMFVVNWMMNYKRSDLSFIIFVFCFCVLLYKKLNRRKADVNRMAIYLTPVFLLVIACASLLPAANQTWDNTRAVEFFKNPLNATNDFFYFIFNPKYFSFQTTGFEGQNGRLGGSLSLNNREIMQVTADSPVYLAGEVKDVYTGSAWLSSSPDFTQPYSADEATSEAIETQLNLPLVPAFRQLANDYVTIRDMTVNIGSSRTGTIFRPMKNDGVKINTDLNLLTDAFGDIRLSDVMPANAEYSFQYMDIDYSNPAVLNILRQSHRGMYQEAVDNDMYVGLLATLSGSLRSGQRGINRLNGVFNGQNPPDQKYIWAMWEYQKRARPQFIAIDPKDYFQGKLIPYADSVYNTFLNVPDTVPQRVKDLAVQVTAQAGNDYDRAKAIESYLVKIPYTLLPGPTPQDRDFVDYFLFDLREGYCTYYASAMAIMCRSIGLPARYVEGYIMPETSTNGVYDVTNLQAHAWVEVYFEGFGWVPFEPTAPYSYSYYQTTPPPDTQVFAPDFSSNPAYQQYMEQIMSGAVQVPPASGGNTQAAEIAAAQKTNALAAALAVMALVLFLMAGFAFLFLRGKFSIWHRQNRIRRMPRNEQAIEYFHDILKMTAFHRYPMRVNETPSMYAKRVGKRFAFKNDTIFIRDLAAIYNRAKYGGAQIRKEDLSLMKNSRRELLAFLRYIKGKPAYIWNRYITRRI